MATKVSNYIAEFLYAQGTTCVFEVVGGMITHLIDSIHTQGRIKLVSVHHEQAAAFAAEGYARISGIPGVAMATSGPGATNLLTGIGSCYFDSVPAVFITGQVNRNEIKGDRPIRQLGFQETDIVSMVQPITKQAWRVENPEDVPQILVDAFTLALSGRPGPVLLDIPMDVQRVFIEAPPPQRVVPASETDSEPLAPLIASLIDDLKRAKRPLVLAGGGLHAPGAVAIFREVAAALGVPVVNSLMGVDVLPYDDPLHVGFIGSYGNRWANLALGTCDFLLVLGSRLDIRQTGADTDSFKGDRVIYHVDVDAGELNNRVLGCVAIHSHLTPFLEALQGVLNQRPVGVDWTAWRDELARLQAQWLDTAELSDIQGINPNRLMHRLAQASGTAGAYVVDVGQHQMWAAQSVEVQAHQRFLTSGGMGAMGYSLPAAVGTAFAMPETPILLIAGDGSFQLNIQELQTVFRNQLPLKMVVLHNQSHGMVRQFQQSYFHERYASTVWGYSAPNFVRVAEAYGIEGAEVSDEDGLDEAITRMWRDPAAPFLLQVAIDPAANVYPKIAFGHPITEMEPFAKPIAMEGT